MKKSGLSKDKLKLIWVIAAQTDPQQLERDEFNIALRLIALAQNNMEVSDESIKLNHPLPPLPKFDLKSGSTKNQGLNTSQIDPIEEQFLITEDDIRKYTLLFNKNKDLENKMTINKAQTMWTTAGIALDTIKKILTLVPLEENTEMSFNEFKVIFHLIYKSYNYDLPASLPICLKNSLDIPKESNKNNSNNNSIISQSQIIPNSNSNIAEKLNFFNSQAIPINTTLNNSSIPYTSNLNTNKSINIDSLVINEFKNKESSSPSIPEATYDESMKYSLPTTNTNKVVNQTQSSINNINPGLNSYYKNINENLGNVVQEVKLESQFLNKILDEDNNNLTNILTEIEKLSLNIKSLTDQNKYIRENILEVRKKINIERDNLTKLIQEQKFKNQELNKSQGN
jgi:hypothetical protein